MLTDETIRRVAKFFDIMSNDLLKLKKKLFELKESYSFNPRKTNRRKRNSRVFKVKLIKI